ncbi:MAG: hypothetical protein DRG59_09535, partial [Deltaproteobacteria bacterium]
LHLVLAVKNAIREFTNDTTSLLHHVYLSEPMLKAAPEEALDFSCVSEQEVAEDRDLEKQDIGLKTFSKKELNELRTRIRDKVKAKKKSPQLVTPYPSPVYDEVFYKGLQALDALAGDPIPEGDHIVEFSEEVWKSLARYDPELS